MLDTVAPNEWATAAPVKAAQRLVERRASPLGCGLRSPRQGLGLQQSRQPSRIKQQIGKLLPKVNLSDEGLRWGEELARQKKRFSVFS